MFALQHQVQQKIGQIETRRGVNQLLQIQITENLET